jgi:hypothetical protein
MPKPKWLAIRPVERWVAMRDSDGMKPYDQKISPAIKVALGGFSLIFSEFLASPGLKPNLPSP